MKTKTRSKSSKPSKPAKPNVYQLVTDQIIAQLASGVVPWRCPWDRRVGTPRNFQSGHAYRGVNVLLLGLQQFASPFWLTYRQARELGGNVRKGEKGSMVVKFGKHQAAKSSDDGEDESRSRMFLRYYHAFNAAQIDGIDFPAADQVELPDGADRIDRAEQIVASVPDSPVIREGRASRACYNRATDTIDVPDRRRFAELESFYATLFHELVHATGHERRLNRKTLMQLEARGDEDYSKEELVAEMGAAFVAMEAGIVLDAHEQSAAYIGSWLSVLGDPDHSRWVVYAASQASKAADFILARNADVPSQAAP